jgi:hypothetical protein
MKVAAACHVHSNWSYDGNWSLESLATEFSRYGYRILMMTEHDRGLTESRFMDYREACARASCDKIFFLPGVEYSDPSNTVHVMVWGQVPFCGEGLSTKSVLETVSRSANGVAVLAHPSRQNAWMCFESTWADSLLGTEMWNRKVDGWSPSETAPSMLRESGAIPFVGLDFHGRRQMFPLSMLLDLQKGVNEDSILDSLRSRRCQAHAFGLALNANLLNRMLPLLNMAERFRRIISKTERLVRAERFHE